MALRCPEVPRCGKDSPSWAEASLSELMAHILDRYHAIAAVGSGPPGGVFAGMVMIREVAR